MAPCATARIKSSSTSADDEYRLLDDYLVVVGVAGAQMAPVDMKTAECDLDGGVKLDTDTSGDEQTVLIFSVQCTSVYLYPGASSGRTCPARRLRGSDLRGRPPRVYERAPGHALDCDRRSHLGLR